MNIIENGAIDWSMFGLSIKNFRRGKGLDQAQFAEFLNRVNGEDGDIITEAQVKRIEDGKLKPTLDQLFAFDKATNRPNRMTAVLEDMVDCFMGMAVDVATVPMTAQEHGASMANGAYAVAAE